MNFQFLNEEYVNKGRSIRSIAQSLGTSPSNISRELKKYNIKPRSKSEAQSLYLQNTNNHPTKGKERSETTKCNIGKTIIKKWEQKPEEEKAKFVERGKKNYEKNGETLKRSGHAGVRLSSKRGSKLEIYIDKYLRERGITVEFHKNMLTNEKLEVDMYVPQYKTVIEINGPSHYLPIRGEEKLIQQKNADMQKIGLITSSGFLYIRVKNLTKASLVRYNAVAEQVYQTLMSPDFNAFSSRVVDLET